MDKMYNITEYVCTTEVVLSNKYAYPPYYLHVIILSSLGHEMDDECLKTGVR